MKRIPFIFIGLVMLAAQAFALDASSLKLQVYSVMISTSSLCTSPTTIFNNAVPTEVDFLVTPVLGSSGSPSIPADGTYNCVIIKMSDNIKFKPSTTSGSCTAGTEYTADVCRTDNSGSTRAPDAGGAATACTGNATTASPDPVYLYLTTNVTAGTGGNTFLQPTSTVSTNGINLTSPLVVAGTTASRFSVNATGKVDGSGVTCGMNPPVFGFR